MPFDTRVAILLPDTRKLELMQLRLPDPGATEVVVQLYASGICHSQLHQIHDPRSGPVALGHEATGAVAAIGSAVEHVAVGDDVLVTWVPRNPLESGRSAPWMTLELPDGSSAKCQNVFTWAEHCIADEQYIVKVDGELDAEVSCIIACAVMTGAGAVMHTAGVQTGESVVVYGVGGVGLSAVAGARHVGADPIIAVDLDETKLAMARRFGATHCINASRENPVERIHELTARPDAYTFMQKTVSGADYALDCIGLQQTVDQIIASVRSGQFGHRDGGTAVVVGVPAPEVKAAGVRDMLINEKKLLGCFAGGCRPDRDFPIFLDWHRTGALDLNELVTERFALDQVNEAVQALEHGELRGRAVFVY